MLFKPTYSRLFFDADSGAGGGGATGPASPPAGATGASGPSGASGADGPTISPEVQRLIDNAARGARIEGEKAGKKSAEDALAAKAEEDRIKRENDEAIKRGEFDTVKASLETDAKTAKERADAAEAKAGEYEKLITPIVAERLETLKAASADVAKGFPAEASVLDQLAWLDDPRTKALIAAQAATNQKYLGHVNTPKPNADSKPKITSLVNTRSI